MYVRKLTITAYLKLFLYAQIQSREGLWHIADDMLRKPFQRELGLESISVAQLSRKHNQVDPNLLQQVFECLVRRIIMLIQHRLHVIRSRLSIQPLALYLQKYNNGQHSEKTKGIKTHMRLAFIGEQDVMPEKATITHAKRNDRTQLDEHLCKNYG